MAVFGDMLSLKDAADIWKIDDSTIRKSIQATKFVYGEDCRKFGKQWVVTVPAMKRNFGMNYDVNRLRDLLVEEFSR